MKRVVVGRVAAQIVLCSMLALFMWSCGESVDTPAPPASEAPDEAMASQQITDICGVDKHDGPQGIDVSKWQATFDWQQAKTRGTKFAYARATIGTTKDEQFDRNWNQMQQHGILRGAYHAVVPSQGAAAQANAFVEAVGQLGPGELPAAIDIERSDGVDKATLRSKLRTILDIVEQGTGKKPVIYTAAYWFRDNIGENGFGGYPLWVANYGAQCPLVSDNWNDWVIWQYCGGGQYCPDSWGIDRDVFNGTQQELEEFAGVQQGPAWSASIVEHSFESGPAQVLAGGTFTAYVEVENTGTETWTTDTKLGTSEPRGRDSIFAHDSWASSKRPATVSDSVAPGETYRFEFTMQAPQSTGTYDEYFALLQEGDTWFSDDGGPADDSIHMQLEVVEDQTGDDAGVDAGDSPDAGGTDAGQTGDDAGQPDAGTDGGADAGLVDDNDGTDDVQTNSGCSSVSDGPSTPTALLGLLVVLLFGAHRRRL